MSRGDHQEAIYRDDKDRHMFVSCLEEVCGKTKWQVHAYVLMGNHYHLLIETPVGDLARQRLRPSGVPNSNLKI